MKNLPPKIFTDCRFDFLREGHVTFRAVEAELILRECRYDRQRDENKAQAHIGAMAEDMRRGNWLPKQPLDFAVLDGRPIMVNGHHRMHSQIEARADILWTITLHPCETIDEVRQLYYRFDTKLRKRTDENIIQGLDLVDEHNLSRTIARALWRAAPIIANDLRIPAPGTENEASRVRRMTDDRAEVFRAYAREARQIADAITPAPHIVRNKILSVKHFSVAVVTMVEMPEMSAKFWGGLAENDGLRKGDPRHTLLQYLINENTNKRRANEAILKTVIAWNAWVRGDDLKILKVFPGSKIKMLGSHIVVEL